MFHLVFSVTWQHKYQHSRADLSMVYCKQTPRDWQLIRIFSLMNKNSQCCSLVLAYSFRSWHQSTLPSIQFWPSLVTELFVASGHNTWLIRAVASIFQLVEHCTRTHRSRVQILLRALNFVQVIFPVVLWLHSHPSSHLIATAGHLLPRNS